MNMEEKKPFLRHATNEQSAISPWRFKPENVEKCPQLGKLVRVRQIGDRVRCPQCDHLCACPRDVEHDQEIRIDRV